MTSLSALEIPGFPAAVREVRIQLLPGLPAPAAPASRASAAGLLLRKPHPLKTRFGGDQLFFADAVKLDRNES